MALRKVILILTMLVVGDVWAYPKPTDAELAEKHYREEHCVKMTPKKEAEIHKIIEKIGDFLNDLVSEHEDYDIRLVKFDIESITDHEDEERETVLQVTINDCADLVEDRQDSGDDDNKEDDDDEAGDDDEDARVDSKNDKKGNDKINSKDQQDGKGDKADETDDADGDDGDKYEDDNSVDDKDGDDDDKDGDDDDRDADDGDKDGDDDNKDADDDDQDANDDDKDGDDNDTDGDDEEADKGVNSSKIDEKQAYESETEIDTVIITKMRDDKEDNKNSTATPPTIMVLNLLPTGQEIIDAIDKRRGKSSPLFVYVEDNGFSQKYVFLN